MEDVFSSYLRVNKVIQESHIRFDPLHIDKIDIPKTMVHGQKIDWEDQKSSSKDDVPKVKSIVDSASNDAIEKAEKTEARTGPNDHPSQGQGLIRESSDEVGSCIGRMQDHGKKHDQAIAICMHDSQAGA